MEVCRQTSRCGTCLSSRYTIYFYNIYILVCYTKVLKPLTRQKRVLDISIKGQKASWLGKSITRLARNRSKCEFHHWEHCSIKN